MGEEEREEMARLASLVRRVSEFAVSSAGAYYYFSFGMSIVGLIIISIVIADLLQISEGLAAVSGIIAGTALSLALTTLVTGPMWRYLASQGLIREPGRLWAIPLGFGAGFSLAYSVAVVAPEWYPPIAWYLGLGISFIGLSFFGRFVERAPYHAIFAFSGVLLLASSPIVVYLAISRGPETANAMASGLILIIYLLAGSYAMRAAAKRFEEA